MGRNATFEPRRDKTRTGSPWCVSIPPRLSDSGKRQRRFYKTKEEALGAAHLIKVRKENYGTAAKLLSPAQEQQAQSAFVILRETESDRQLVEIIGEYVERKQRKTASKPLGKAWDAFLSRPDKSLSAIYQRNLKATKKRLLPLHDKMLVDITSTEIEKCLAGLSPSNWNSKIREIRAVLNWCMRGTRKWLSENPAIECEFMATETLGEVLIYTPEQIRLLMDTTLKLYPKLIPAMACMAFAGIRPDHKDGEIVKLEWSHVLDNDRHDRRIVLPGRITKTGKQRHITIRPALLSWIRWHFNRGGKKSELVCPEKGEPLRKKIRAIFEESKVARIQDGLRHSFASYLAPVATLDTVESELGHLGGRDVLNRHYRTDVRKSIANKFWALRAPK